jgi:phosphomannomutase
MAPSVSLTHKSWAAIRNKLQHGFAGMAPDLTDGIKLSGKDCWVHVRVSNTEPIIRLIAEASNEAAARALLRRAKRLIR